MKSDRAIKTLKEERDDVFTRIKILKISVGIQEVKVFGYVCNVRRCICGLIDFSLERQQRKIGLYWTELIFVDLKINYVQINIMQTMQHIKWRI